MRGPATKVAVGLAILLAPIGCADGSRVITDASGAEASTDSSPETSVAVEPGSLSDEQILDRARDLAARSGDEEPDEIEWVRVDSRNRAREVILGDGGSADGGDQPVIVVGMRGSFTDAAFRQGDPVGEGDQRELVAREAVYFTIDESLDMVMDVVATNDIVDLNELGPTTHP
jgi:hypothetical protein